MGLRFNLLLVLNIKIEMNNYSFRQILLPFFLIFNSFCFSQQIKIDSLLNLIKTDKPDTNKVKHLNELGWELMKSNPDTSIIIGNQALQLAEEISVSTDETIAMAGKKGIAKSLGNLGSYYRMKADYPKALHYYFKALKMAEDLKYKILIAKIFTSIGIAYKEQADYPKALDYYFKSLKTAEEIGDKNTIANNLGNIGLIYSEQANYPQALDYHFKALKTNEGLGNKFRIANNLCSIGIVYMEQADYPKALDYYLKALKMAEDLGNKNLIVINLSNIGSVYNYQGDYQKALHYYFKVLKMDEERIDKNSVAIDLGNIGSVYFKQADLIGPQAGYTKANLTERNELLGKALDFYFKALKIKQELGNRSIATDLANIGLLYIKTGKFIQAENYLKHALALNDTLGDLGGVMETNQNLSELYDTTGRVKLAFEHYKKYIAARDSINSEENQKKQVRTEINHEFEKKEALAKAEQDKKDLIAEEEKQKQKLFLWFTIGGLAVVVIVSIFIFRSLQINKKKNKIISEQKEIVEHQKKVVEEKQKEILDSIHYAKRIQTALLTTEKYINRNLNTLKK